VNLAPRQVATYANAVAHALGLKDANGALLSFDEPNSPKVLDALYARLGTALDARRPSKHAPSIGEVIAALVWSRETASPRARATRWPPPPSARWTRPGRDGRKRALAELTELVAQGAYDRTKRAERGRVLAELLLLFDLEDLLDVEPTNDAEAALRRVRRALATR
jgi:hypothetical protein